MRLDSSVYRFIWRLKRRFYRYRDKCGPRPIVEMQRPCRNFAPPATVLEVVRGQNCSEKMANFERLCAQLQLVPHLTNYLPTQLEERDWHNLLALQSVRERLSYLSFLVKRNNMKLKTKRQKKQKQLMRSGEGTVLTKKEEKVEEEEKETMDEEETVEEGEEEKETALERAKEEAGEQQLLEKEEDEPTAWENKLLVYPYICTAERMAASHRYIRSLQLAETPRIAIDCRFLPMHTVRGLNLTMIQLQLLLGANRDRQWPWPVHLCNYPSTSSAGIGADANNDDGDAVSAAVAAVDEHRRQKLDILDSPRYVTGEVHTMSYTELFPELRKADKIVYLSPHSKEVLTCVDADACYVIGAIVDRQREPRIPLKASLLVSDEEQLPCRRLPIPHEFLRGGNPMLTLAQVLAILQHVFHSPGGDDWLGAFEQHIPKRKRLAPAEKNTIMRLRYENLHARNREIARIIEERTPTKAADGKDDQQQTNRRSDQKMGAFVMRFLSRIFG